MSADAEERTSLLGQVAQEWIPFALPVGELPDPTPPDGPDPYGSPDPQWLGVDWGRHLRHVELPMADDGPSQSGSDRRLAHDGGDRRPAQNGASSGAGSGARTRVNYVETGPTEGSGAGDRAVLLVHGLSGSWQNWLENIPHLARSRRVIALDLPGFGSSPMPRWEPSIESYGRLVHRFCDALEISDCVAVGNSMGGFISAEAAIAEPGRFEKLVLVSAAGVSHARMRKQPIETAARMTAAVMPTVFKLQQRGLRRARVRYATFRGVFHRPHRLRPELLIEQFESCTGRPGFLPALSGLIGYDILDRLPEIEVPTLIVWGRNDRVVPPNDATAYAERISDSRLVIFDQTGHCPQLERPVRFNRLLDGFLDE